MKHIVLILSAVLVFGQVRLSAQSDYFDASSITALIEQNKKEYDNKKKQRESQTLLTLASNEMKKAELKLTAQYDSLSKRLNSFFIIVADADLVARVASEIAKIYDYQQKAITLAKDMPLIYPLVVDAESKIIKKVERLVTFTVLIVNSYTQISRMKVGDRRKIYTQFAIDLFLIRVMSESLMRQMQNIHDAGQINYLKGQAKDKIMQNRDVQKMREILNQLKL